MKRFLLILVLVLVAAGAVFFLRGGKGGTPAIETAGAPKEVRFGTEGAYPPFNFIDASGAIKGFDVEIAEAICAKAALKCTFVAQDWDGLIPGLLAHKYDAIAASMSITDERAKAVSFTDRYYRTPIRFVAMKEKPLDISPEGLKGKRIGVQRSTTSAIYLDENYRGVVQSKAYDTQETVILELLSGRLDGMLVDAILAYDWLATDAGKNYEFRGETYFVDSGIGIAMRKDDEPLKGVLNQALAAILQDGTYEKINKKYFPFSIY
jgi:polar amino acid transport system substrate-binding protein